MIHVIATIQVQPGARDRFLEAFQELVPLVRGEAGCLDYGPTVDLPTSIGAQGDERPDVVVVVERWADLEALEAHLIAPHMLAYREKVKDLVSSTSIQILQPV